MNEELRELYQELIIDHGRHPRNFQILGNHTHCQKGITLYAATGLHFISGSKMTKW